MGMMPFVYQCMRTFIQRTTKTAQGQPMLLKTQMLSQREPCSAGCSCNTNIQQAFTIKAEHLHCSPAICLQKAAPFMQCVAQRNTIDRQLNKGPSGDKPKLAHSSCGRTYSQCFMADKCNAS